MSGSVAEPGRYAVVRVWVSPEMELEYVRMPDRGGVDRWIQVDDAGGWSWEQVVRDALRIEVVRGGIEADPQPTDQEPGR